MKRFLLPIAALALCQVVHAGHFAVSRCEELPEERGVAAPASQDVSFSEGLPASDAVHPDDSVRMYRLQEIEVTATRATGSTPVAYSSVSREEIARNSFGYDIPSVLALTPSMIATNETGIGIGGTSMRLRGTDATRLNVTINGVPMNNPDSHSMYWYDTPDLVSAVGDMQIQRGAGISTNGTGAFGGAINMTTETLSTQFGGSASLSYGSYNTNKQAVHFSSGLLGGHWALDGRLTHIGSEGYIDRGSTDLCSYMFQAGYYGGSTMVKFVSFGGKAKTYLTYNGVSKEDMARYGRRYHDSGQYATSDGPFTLYDKKGNPYHVDYYDDQTDNYLQINNQLLFNHTFNKEWSMNATAFYTYGDGFYKQYKDDAKLVEYGFADDVAFDSEGNKVRKDLIRKKVMRNHLGGLNAAAHYHARTVDVSFGGSYSYYSCPHWGELEWIDGGVEFDRNAAWYYNDVNKHDFNIFGRANWTVAEGLNLFADLQYRYVSYEAWGVNDNYVSSSVGMQPIDVDKRYHFFNPHAGLTYSFAKHHTLFASFAIAQKEPTRGDFTDRYMYADDDSYPSSEKMFDYEIGYRFELPAVTVGANLYYMYYKNQLVKTGRINDNYDALNINVPKSYRRGIELSAAWRALPWFTVGANATFSQNRIKNYVDKVVDYAVEGNVTDDGYGYHTREMGTTRISYSPETMGSLFLDFHIRGFEALLHTQYVGEQYFTNFANPDMRLDSYCVTNLNLGYTLRTRAARSVRFGVAIYNLFDARYESNGYGWSESYEGVRTDHAFYFPQAPLHVLANVTVKF
ncbi:MAG: TonB-dependent receptor [Alistipes sp.]|nr:TonB-dependent receptor [Alistipes sp.]